MPNRKIGFFRHGKAKDAAEGQPDIDRQLSEDGLKQAAALGERLKGLGIGMIVATPAPRGFMTGAIACGVSVEDIVIVPSIYPDPHDGIGKRIDVQYTKLGNAAVSKYLNEDDGEAIMDYAHDVLPVILSEIARAGNPAFAAVFGHGTCSQALGMALCHANKQLVEQLANLVLDVGEGFVVTLDADHRPFAIELFVKQPA